MLLKASYQHDHPNGKKVTRAFTPKQLTVIKNYLDPHSKTFGNWSRSMLAAGYKAGTARHQQLWMQNGLASRESLLIKAEKNLDNLLDSSNDRVRLDVSKFIAERIGKSFYAQRSESISRNENVVVVLPPEIIQKNSLEPREKEFNILKEFSEGTEHCLVGSSEEDSSR
jgi:hypothetical protein